MLDKFVEKKISNFIIGVDEVGRGPLAGPVVSAAVILSEDFDTNDINDSKKLSKSKRELPDLAGGYINELLTGGLYPIDDPDLLMWEREKHLIGDDPHSPYVPHGGSIEHCLND